MTGKNSPHILRVVRSNALSIDVNIKGVMNGVSAVIPSMMSNSSGHIVNISSVAGRKVFPGASVYCATKFAVRAFSEGIRMEMSPAYNIKVTVIEPGAVATELTGTITDEDVVNSLLPEWKKINPLTGDDIARSVLYAVTQPDNVNVSEIMVMPSSQS